MSDLRDKMTAVIVQRFVEEGLDASYMSDEEIAQAAAQAITERLSQVGWHQDGKPPAERLAPYFPDNANNRDFIEKLGWEPVYLFDPEES